MPNILNLRKQAKLVLCWHRDRYHPVAAQIRTLPRFRHLSDREVLAADFKLRDAQELVARQLGFENWQALKKGIDTMPHQPDQTHSKPIILATAAQFLHAEARVLDRLCVRRAALLCAG